MTLLTPKFRWRAQISELIDKLDPETCDTSNEIPLLYNQVFINWTAPWFIMQNDSEQPDITDEINSKLSFIENVWSIEWSLRHCNIAIKEIWSELSTFPVLQNLLYTQEMLSESIEKLEVPKCSKDKFTISLDFYSSLPLAVHRHISLMNKSIESMNI